MRSLVAHARTRLPPPPRSARLATGLLLLSAALLLPAAGAHAVLVQRGDLFVTFDGRLTPGALPRRALAPIAVGVEGRVRVLSGERPPALRRITIALNRGGRLDPRGLPVCRRSRLRAATPAGALAACGPALVGHGRYAAATAFPEQATFPSHGRILVFNARVDGRPAILAHVYGTSPTAIARVIVFHIHHTAGVFGTVLSGYLPASLNRYGYIELIALELHREFTYHGARRSYLSAACAAPPGFPGATFPFARATMGFADGRVLGSTIVRSCRVRDG